MHGKGIGMENLERRADAVKEIIMFVEYGTLEAFPVVRSCITHHGKTQWFITTAFVMVTDLSLGQRLVGTACLCSASAGAM